MVLRRVEHLEQRGRGISAPVGADLVDLVEQDHRVHRPGVTERPDKASRQRADVRAPVAADLGLIPDTAKRHADELAVQSASDRFAHRRLAGSGRADQGEDRAGALVLGDPSLLAQLAHGQVLDDPVLHVLEARVIGVEHLSSVARVEPLLGARAPRHREQPVEVGADHRRLAGLVADPLEARSLALGLLPDAVRHRRLGDLLPIVVGGRAVVFAELLADRLELLAQDVLALLLRSAVLDVVADPAAYLQFGEPFTLERDGELQTLDHVDRLEQLDLLVEGDLGRVGDGVGQRSRLTNRADEGRDAPIVAAQLENLLDGCPILTLELADLNSGRLFVGPFDDLDAQLPLRVGVSGPELGAMEAGQADSALATRQTNPFADFGDGSDLGVFAFVTGNEQHALVFADVDGDRHGHVREDDQVVERYEQQ